MAFFIKDFFNNPAGKGSAILNINATKAKFEDKYNSIHKKIIHKTFSVKDNIYILLQYHYLRHTL